MANGQVRAHWTPDDLLAAVGQLSPAQRACLLRAAMCGVLVAVVLYVVMFRGAEAQRPDPPPDIQFDDVEPKFDGIDK
jgi:hypothetical protein